MGGARKYTAQRLITGLCPLDWAKEEAVHRRNQRGRILQSPPVKYTLCTPPTLFPLSTGTSAPSLHLPRDLYILALTSLCRPFVRKTISVPREEEDAMSEKRERVRMNRRAVFAAVVLGLALYCGLDPFMQSPMVEFPGFETYKVVIPPDEEIPQDRDLEDLLQKSEIRFLGQVQGPESLAFDPQGRGPYTGVADGRVVFWDGHNWSTFAYTSPNRSDDCGWKASVLGYLKHEHVCGRPLGLRFHRGTGELYIADAYLGLLKVGPGGGLAETLATEAEGVPFKFTNDLDVDSHGNVYFTDTSTNYQRRHFLQLVTTSEPTGRLLKYDPRTKETTVLVRDIQFANGVSLNEDESFVAFCEGSRGRLSRYWLKGNKAGKTETVVNLPGIPDNVRINDEGDFWVAIHSRRYLYARILARHPRLRKFIMKLPIPAKYHYLLSIGGRLHAMAIKLSPEGRVLQVLEDRTGKVVRLISEVEEKDGKLWLGSVLMSFIAVYDLNSSA
ncbi:protein STRICTOSIDINE SYNTHASE-LIKE 3-like [Wolffia australiana]